MSSLTNLFLTRTVSCSMTVMNSVTSTAIDTALEFHPDKKESRHAALPVVTPNVRIELGEPMMVQTLLFMPRKVKTIYLALDEPSAFAQMMREKCNFLA